MSETPSWAAPKEPARRRVAGPVPPALVAAGVVTAVVVAVEIAHVAGRDELVPGLRIFLVVMIAAQVVMAVGTARRSATAAVALLVCQLTTIVAAVAGGFGDLRLALAVGAAAVIVLVVSALGSFPSVAIPPLDRGRDDA